MTTGQFSYALKSKLLGDLCLIIIGTEGGFSKSDRTSPGLEKPENSRFFAIFDLTHSWAKF
jgi:hypothetical protein